MKLEGDFGGRQDRENFCLFLEAFRKFTKADKIVYEDEVAGASELLIIYKGKKTFKIRAESNHWHGDAYFTFPGIEVETKIKTKD
jgi:hypothetical protein